MLELHIWNTRNGNRVATFQDEQSENIIWSPDSKKIALSNDHIRIINAAIGSLLFTCASGLGAALSWSPNAGRVGSGTAFEAYNPNHGIPTFQVWDAVSGKNVVNYLNTRHTANQQENVPDEEDAGVYLLAWSPDRQYIAAVTGHKFPLIEIWKGGW